MSVLIGRDGELRRLTELLDGGASLLTLTGPAGVGKTRLARAVQQSSDRSIVFCDLRDASSTGALCEAIASALVLAADDPSAIQRALACEPLLIILDNFEALARTARNLLSSWLDAAPELQMLVTSRERLDLPEERAIELGPLPDDEARALWIARMSELSPLYRPSPADEPIIAELIRELDGIPLAIELAVPRAAVIGSRALLDRMQDRFLVLGDDLRLDVAWQLLDRDEQSMLEQCSVFRGGFSIDAVEAVVSLPGRSVIDVLQSLRAKSWIRSESGRLSLYLSIRAFAQDRLEKSGSKPSVLRRHALFHVSLTDRTQDLHRLILERDNLWQAADHLLDSDRDDDLALALKLLVELSAPARLLGMNRAWMERIDRAFPRADALPASILVPAVVERCLHALRAAAPDGCADQLDRAHALAAGDPALEGLVLHARAVFECPRGNFEEAMRHAGRALELGERTGEPILAARAHDELALLNHLLGRLAEARSHSEAALALLIANDVVFDQLPVMVELTFVLVESGCTELARETARRAMLLGEKLGAPRGGLHLPLLFAVARADHAEGLLTEAERGYLDASQLAETLGDERFYLFAEAYRQLVRFEQGAIAEATVGLRLLMPKMRKLPGHTHYSAFLIACLAVMEASIGDAQHAKALLEEAALIAGPLQRALELARAAIDGSRPSAASNGEASLLEIRILERWLSRDRGPPAEPPSLLTIGPEARWFDAPDGRRIRCGARPVMRRMLLALAEGHRRRAGRALTADELIAAGWPEERIIPAAARRRLQVMIGRMRELGLRDVLLTDDRGYFFRPDLELVQASGEM